MQRHPGPCMQQPHSLAQKHGAARPLAAGRRAKIATVTKINRGNKWQFMNVPDRRPPAMIS